MHVSLGLGAPRLLQLEGIVDEMANSRAETAPIVAFGKALPAGTRLTLFSDDKPDRFFTVIKFWMDETSGVALALKTGVPT
jgi:hypothetical protein